MSEYSINNEKLKRNNKIIMAAIIVLILAVAGSLIGIKIYHKAKGITISTSNVNVGKYLKVKPDNIELNAVTEEDIVSEIDLRLENYMIKTPIIDRPINYGDFVIVDYNVYQDGKIAEGGKEKDREIEIKPNDTDYVKGFVDGLVGHNLNEEVTLDLTFPDTFKVAKYRNKQAMFKVTIKEIYSKSKPELTDEFVAKNIKGCNNIENFKSKVRVDLAKRNEKQYNEDRMNNIWSKVVNKSKVKSYNRDEVKLKKKQFKTTYKRNASESGLSYDEYLINTFNMTSDAFKDKLDDIAKDKMKQNYVAHAIADKEDIELTDKELKKDLKSMAKASGYSSSNKMIKTFKKEMNEEDYKDYFLMKKVMKFLLKHSK